MGSIFNSLQSLPSGAALAVGTFDGVHRGHRALLEAMKSFAKTARSEPWVLSFEGTPSSFLRPQSDLGSIYDSVLQCAYLQDFGISLIRQCFDSDFACVSASEFLTLLRGATVFCGADWRFGKGAEGDVAFLKAHGVSVHVVPDVDYEDARISSTRIRQALQIGALDHVTAMLGRPWEFIGVVQHGRALAGKTFGVPTLNIPYIGRHEERLVSLAYGVYCGEAEIRRGANRTATFPALIHFGVAPSVKNEPAPLFEVHLLDVIGDFYGAEVTLRISHPRMRPEQKFASLEMLRSQIYRDLAQCKGLLKR